MIRYDRPEEPAVFSADVAAAQADAAARIESSGVVKDEAAWDKYKFPRHWSDHKEPFQIAQYGKCGYCERQISGHGDMEHFVPKKRVEELISEGEENPATRRPKEKTRRGSGFIRPGYWWRAYDWTNYLLACAQCNQGWKRNFVSVTPSHSAASVPQVRRGEQIQMLNPFDDDPEDFLKFRCDGVVSATEPKGRDSIRIFGLDRPSLQETREDIFGSARAIARGHWSGSESRATLLGQLHPKRTFAATRRAAVKQVFKNKMGKTDAEANTLMRGLIAEALA